MTVVHGDEAAAPVGPGGATGVGRRRRGELLVEEIYAACRAELREHGYSALTMDRVAVRARAGKATLYRRWPSKVELVADTLRHYAPVLGPPPDTGHLRDDLLALLRTAADELNGPACEASRGLLAELVRNPELAALLRDRMTDPIVPLAMEVLRRAVVRGERRDFREEHPTTATLVVEVAVSSVAWDRENASLYAEAGVEEYWMVLPMLRGLAAAPPPGS